MPRIQRKVIAIKGNTVRWFDSQYACAKELGVTIRAVSQAQDTFRTCKGWKIFDSPERICQRIDEMLDALHTLREHDADGGVEYVFKEKKKSSLDEELDAIEEGLMQSFYE